MSAAVAAPESAPLSISPSRSLASDVDSEYECELMIEALQRELQAVRSQLAFLTHKLDVPQQQADPPPLSSPSRPPQQQTHRPPKPPNKKVVGPLAPAATTSDQREVWRYLDVVDKMEDKRWKMRKKCLQLMQTHIEQQLVKLQEKELLLKKRLRRREKKIKAERLKLKPPRFRSLGQDDTAFLKHLPQSTFYQIVGEEHRLRQAGKLSSLADIKEFWECMLSPIKALTPPPSHKPHPFVPVEDEDETSDSWAITALPRHPSPVRSMPQAPSTVPRSTPSTDMFKFVPGKLPEIRPISDIFNEREKLMEEKQEAECLHRIHELTTERRRVRNMYQQARANEMAMRRLLPQLLSFDTSPSEDDVIMTSLATCSSSEAEVEPTQSQISESLEEHHREEVEIADRISAESTIAPITSPRPTSEGQRSLDDLSPHRPRVCVPLTMDSVLQQSTIVMEPKQKSALWSNYLKTGNT